MTTRGHEECSGCFHRNADGECTYRGEFVEPSYWCGAWSPAWKRGLTRLLAEIVEHAHKRLRKAYQRALAADAQTFTFDGRVSLVAYAKYMLQFLDERLRP